MFYQIFLIPVLPPTSRSNPASYGDGTGLFDKLYINNACANQEIIKSLIKNTEIPSSSASVGI